MSATKNCPSGHSNSAEQKFCGQCGVSLAGVCANGHPNPEGQQFCGQCGVPLGQSSSIGPPHSAAPGAMPPGSAVGFDVSGTTPPAADPRPEPRIDGNAGLSDGLGAPAVRAGLSGTSGGLKSFWTRLPKWGKVAAIAALPLLVVVAFLAGGGRDRESYEFGYGQGSSGMMQPANRIGSAEEACESMMDYWIKLLPDRRIKKRDAMAGCLDGTSGRPLAPGG